MPKGPWSGKSDIWMFGWATLPLIDAYSVLAQILSSPREKLGVITRGATRILKWTSSMDKVAWRWMNRAREDDLRGFQACQRRLRHHYRSHQQPMAWAVRDNVKIIQTADDMPAAVVREG